MFSKDPHEIGANLRGPDNLRTCGPKLVELLVVFAQISDQSWLLNVAQKSSALCVMFWLKEVCESASVSWEI